MKQGDAIGQWVVVRTLGKGGMGTVFLCHAAHDENDLAAVKIFPTWSTDEEGFQRFERECEVLSRLDHRGIVPLKRAHARGQDPSTGMYWLAMEYVAGPSLETRLDHGPLPPGYAADIFHTLAEAMEHAHSRGVFHRDLKPANIVLGKDEVRLVDFGIALDNERTRLTAVGTFAGTLAYMPPEVVLDEGARPDPVLSDIYALGVVLYEALTARRAFAVEKGLSDRERQIRILKAKMSSGALDPGGAVPRPLREAVLRATAPSPDDRAQSWSELKALLTQVPGAPDVAGPPTIEAPQASPTPSSASAWRKRSARPGRGLRLARRQEDRSQPAAAAWNSAEAEDSGFSGAHDPPAEPAPTGRPIAAAPREVAATPRHPEPTPAPPVATSPPPAPPDPPLVSASRAPVPTPPPAPSRPEVVPVARIAELPAIDDRSEEEATAARIPPSAHGVAEDDEDLPTADTSTVAGGAFAASLPPPARPRVTRDYDAPERTGTDVGSPAAPPAPQRPAPDLRRPQQATPAPAPATPAPARPAPPRPLPHATSPVTPEEEPKGRGALWLLLFAGLGLGAVALIGVAWVVVRGLPDSISEPPVAAAPAPDVPAGAPPPTAGGADAAGGDGLVDAGELWHDTGKGRPPLPWPTAAAPRPSAATGVGTDAAAPRKDPKSGAIDKRVQRKIQFTVDGGGAAEVYLDGKKRGAAPLTLYLTPGRYQLEFRGPRDTVKREIEIGSFSANEFRYEPGANSITRINQ